MDKMVLESSDEDDTYISSVARLKGNIWFNLIPKYTE